jgi:sugar/nucleoside kinase (ribokinase family)
MDVVCLGILVADIFSNPIHSLPAAGELRVTDRFLLCAGGCATNTAACLRRLGRSVKVIGKVGVDVFGDFVLSDLDRYGIDVSQIRRSPTHQTSGTFILNVCGDDRRYIHFVGANADFSLRDVDYSALAGARVLYVGGYLAMPRFGAQDLVSLLKEAKKRSLLTVVDVVIPAGNSVSLSQVEPILAHTDVFLPNQDEAMILTGEREAEVQADFLGRMNSECTIVITQGHRGALAKRGMETLRAQTYDVKSVDESGAGDAFTAGFITALLENWSLEDSLRFASAVGASCTTKLGCIDGVFQFDEAMEFVSTHSIKIVSC